MEKGWLAGSLLKGQHILCLQKCLYFIKKKSFMYFMLFEITLYFYLWYLCVRRSKQMIDDANDSDVHDTFAISD